MIVRQLIDIYNKIMFNLILTFQKNFGGILVEYGSFCVAPMLMCRRFFLSTMDFEVPSVASLIHEFLKLNVQLYLPFMKISKQGLRI